MEMRPPYNPVSESSSKSVKTADNSVVLAADDVGGAGTAVADADNADGGAVEAKEKIDTVDDDAEQPQKQTENGVIGLWNTIISTLVDDRLATLSSPTLPTWLQH